MQTTLVSLFDTVSVHWACDEFCLHRGLLFALLARRYQSKFWMLVRHPWTHRAEAFQTGHFSVAFCFLRPSAEGELVADAFAIMTVEHCRQVGPAILAGGDTSIRQIHGSWWRNAERVGGDFGKICVGMKNQTLNVIPATVE